MNARGYNDTEWSPEPGDAFRIVALGDSFAFGVVGYEHNFLTLLETELSARIGRPVEVANLGIPGMQPREYLQILLDDGLALRPDLVLLCLYTGNDFQPAGQCLPLRRAQLARGRLRITARPLRRRARIPRSDGARDRARPPRPARLRPSREDGYLRIVEAYVPLLRREPTAKVERGLRETLAVADEIVARARAGAGRDRGAAE